MDAIVPWSALYEVIEPHYPQAGNGRPPIGLEHMLRIHFIQHWFNLADLSCEEILYDSAILRNGPQRQQGCVRNCAARRAILNFYKLGEIRYGLRPSFLSLRKNLRQGVQVEPVIEYTYSHLLIQVLATRPGSIFKRRQHPKQFGHHKVRSQIAIAPNCKFEPNLGNPVELGENP